MLHFRMDMPFYLMAVYGSIMIVIVLLLRGLLKNRLPKFVFPALWGMVLLRLLVPFSLSSPLSLPVISMNFWNEYVTGEQIAILAEDKTTIQHSEQTEVRDSVRSDLPVAQATYISEEAADYSGPEGGFALLFSWRKLLPALYFLGLAAGAGVLVWQKYRCAGKLAESFLMENNGLVNDMLRGMDMGDILVFTSDEIASPMVCGLLNPRIYLPTRMNFQDRALLGNIFAHETMHIRRKDNWKKAVMLAALCLNWYNPLVWIMAKCLASDLEAACDEAVLKQRDEEGRKEYARSLLAMAVTAGRSTLLYSAFSRTEVEKRIKRIVHYKKTPLFVLAFTVFFITASAVVFATGGQAPFSSRLTSYCCSSNSKWGVKVSLTRDIALGKEAEIRAEKVVFSVLGTDTTGDPDVIEEAIRAELGKEFGVEKRAFDLDISLCLDEEEVKKEYLAWGLTKGEDGFWLYQGEQIRIFEDKILGSYQSKEEGTADISVQRDRLGVITEVTVWHAGDKVYDERTKERQRYYYRWGYENGSVIEYGTGL